MRIIGLTGSIACGKTNISDTLISLGVPVIDGDKLSRDLTCPGGVALPEIRRIFGDGFFFQDGTLNRKALGDLVFSDPRALKALDDLMQPLLRDMILQALDELRSSGAPLCVLDMPLLFEKGLDALCDTTWCAWVPEQEQLKRLMARNGYTYQEALSRIRSQLSSDEKAGRSNVVIPATGTIEETKALIPSLYEQELRLATVPVPRRRRTDRYMDTGRVAPIPAQAPVPHAVEPPVPQRPIDTVMPDVMERPVAASKTARQQRKVRNEWRMPAPLTTALIALFFLILGMFTADSLMNAYLTRSREAREAAFNRVVANHPLDQRNRNFIEQYAAEYNLDPAYVAAIIMNESSFRDRAESGVGARGLMQLMPDTAEWIARKLKFQNFNFDLMYEPAINIRFGCWYLNYLSGLFRGDPISVTCAYHAGQGQVTTWLSDPAKSKDGYSLILDKLSDGPTKTYAGRVTQDYGIYKALYYAETDVGSADADTAVHSSAR